MGGVDLRKLDMLRQVCRRVGTSSAAEDRVTALAFAPGLRPRAALSLALPNRLLRPLIPLSELSEPHKNARWLRSIVCC